MTRITVLARAATSFFFSHAKVKRVDIGVDKQTSNAPILEAHYIRVLAKDPAGQTRLKAFRFSPLLADL